MKNTDIAMIVLIAFVAVIGAFFGTKAVLGDMLKTGDESVETIEPISSTITPPDEEVFNSDAINPAVEVQITSNE